MADEQDDDLDLGGTGDMALRTEMAVSEFFLKHAWTIAGVVAVGLVGIGIYGVWTGYYQGQQRATAGDIARVEARLDADMATLAQARAGLRPNVEVDADEVGSTADALVAIAEDASGTAAIEAWLKAAEYHRIAENPTKRRAALEQASSLSSGVLHYAAEAALADLDIEQGNGEEAIQRLRALTAQDGFLERQALLDLAGAYEALGRYDEAVATYEEVLTTWADDADNDDVELRRDKAAERAEGGAAAVPSTPDDDGEAPDEAASADDEAPADEGAPADEEAE